MTEGMSAVFGGRICISSIAAFLRQKNTPSCYANDISVNLIFKYTNLFFNLSVGFF